jgi:hypothetical protein
VIGFDFVVLLDLVVEEGFVLLFKGLLLWDIGVDVEIMFIDG